MHKCQYVCVCVSDGEADTQATANDVTTECHSVAVCVLLIHCHICDEVTVHPGSSPTALYLTVLSRKITYPGLLCLCHFWQMPINALSPLLVVGIWHPVCKNSCYGNPVGSLWDLV